LEKETGVALLERTGRRVVLTPAGAVLAREAEAVLAALERAHAAVRAASDVLAGPLRIGAFPTAVRTLLPSALVALGREHPLLELMGTELDPAEVPDALRDRRLDVGLVQDYDIEPVAPAADLDSVALLTETVYLATPVATDLASTRDTPWIIGSPGTLCHAVTLRTCRTSGFLPRVRHHADDFATVLALVAAGQGVSLVPALAAGSPPPGVHLVPLDLRRRTRIAYRRGSAAHPAVAAFVDALRTATDGVRID
jgi:DNA-binding transcriptional LysR family regulator